jgi:hypothetical protein
LRIRTCHLNHWVKIRIAEEKSWDKKEIRDKQLSRGVVLQP